MDQKLLVLFCAIFGVNSSPAGNIVKCKQDDSECITKNANYIYKQSILGVPELDIENLDPMYQPLIEADLAIIKYTLYNNTLSGFTKCNVIDTRFDIKKLTLRIEMNCPRTLMTGIYEIKGQIISLPIEGKGDYSVECIDYYITIDTDVKLSQSKDGEKYMSIKSYKLDADLRGGLVADLKNLFNGENKELAETVLSFANQNYKVVSKQLQGPVFNANIKKLIKNFNKYFKSIPFSDMIEL